MSFIEHGPPLHIVDLIDTSSLCEGFGVLPFAEGSEVVIRFSSNLVHNLRKSLLGGQLGGSFRLGVTNEDVLGDFSYVSVGTSTELQIEVSTRSLDWSVVKISK